MFNKSSKSCPVCYSNNTYFNTIPARSFHGSKSEDKRGLAQSFFNFREGDRLLRCRDCLHIFLHPKRKSSVDIVYNTDSGVGVEKYTIIQRHAKKVGDRYVFEEKFLKRRLQRFEMLIQPIMQNPGRIKTHRVLDVGSGLGISLHAAHQMGFEAVGIEIDKAAREYAESTFGVRVLGGDFEKHDFPPSEKFSIILMSHTLEHVINPHNIIKKIWSWLRDDGLLIVVVPNIYSREALKDFEHWEFNAGEVHLQYFSFISLQRLLLEYGLVIETSYTKHSEGDGWGTGDCLHVFARKPTLHID